MINLKPSWLLFLIMTFYVKDRMEEKIQMKIEQNFDKILQNNKKDDINIRKNIRI